MELTQLLHDMQRLWVYNIVICIAVTVWKCTHLSLQGRDDQVTTSLEAMLLKSKLGIFFMISLWHLLIFFVFYCILHLDDRLNFYLGKWPCLTINIQVVCWLLLLICQIIFTLSSLSPEPLDQFQPNLVKNIFWWRGIDIFFSKVENDSK